MRRQALSPYAFVAFPLAILAVFSLLPTAAGLALAFFNWNGSGWPHFVGLENFRGLLHDPRFGPALQNTLVFVLATVPASTFLGFLLAVAVHAKWFVGRTLARSLFFLPTVISIVAIGFVWRWLLNDQGGLIPAFLRAIGIGRPPNLLQEEHWPLVSIILVQVWRGVGFCMVLYLAALSNVNESLYEAAEVDGAGRSQVLRHITWPQVAPTTVFLLVTGVIGALQVFDIVWGLTAGAESDASNVLNLYVLREFQHSRLGYAAAIGLVIFALTLAATALQLAVVRRRAA